MECQSQIRRQKLDRNPTSKQAPTFLLKEVIDKEHFLVLKMRPKSRGHQISYEHHDLLLLTPDFDRDTLKTQSTMAIVDFANKTSLSLKIKLPPNSKKYEMFYELLTKDAVFRLLRICKMSTLEREFIALDTIRKSPLLSWITRPMREYKAFKQEAKFREQYFSLPRRVFDGLKKELNESQFRAVKNSLKVRGVTLVQGPPGTGKTRTILGIVSALKTASAPMKSQKVLSQGQRERYLGLNKKIV